jgi:hypothetical protein
MRSVFLASMLVFAFGCGRSDLVNDLYIDFSEPLDGSVAVDAEPDDAFAPPADASSKPPPRRDGSAPPQMDAARVPEDAMDTEDAPFEPDGGPPVLCDPGSCSTGCCYGNICALGTQEIACGHGGAACKVCAAGDVCASGNCLVGLR